MKRSGKGKELKSSSCSAICVAKVFLICVYCGLPDRGTLTSRGLVEQESMVQGRSSSAILGNASIRRPESGGRILIDFKCGRVLAAH